MGILFNKLLTIRSRNDTVSDVGGKMHGYLSKEQYEDLTNKLRELVEKKREPTTTYDYAFNIAYSGHLNSKPFLKIYSDYLMRYPKCSVVDLHAMCLGYGTAGSVIDEMVDQDDEELDVSINKVIDKKKYH